MKSFRGKYLTKEIYYKTWEELDFFINILQNTTGTLNFILLRREEY